MRAMMGIAIDGIDAAVAGGKTPRLPPTMRWMSMGLSSNALKCGHDAGGAGAWGMQRPAKPGSTSLPAAIAAVP